MINKDALVIYKNKPAITKDQSDGKITISLFDGSQIKVRDKDIELIHPGPVTNFNTDNFPESAVNAASSSGAVREVWEFLSDEQTTLSLKDLASYIYNEYSPFSAYAAYNLLRDGLYFSGTIDAVTPKSRDEVTAEETKRNEKQRETGERALFLDQLKGFLKKSSNTDNACKLDDLHSKWSNFMQDVEALAYGKTNRSRTMRDLGLGETPEDAHSVLLKTGFWTKYINPHPGRFGLSFNSANISVSLETSPQSEQGRRDLCHLTAFAIDSPWSNDPDDAISIAKPDGFAEEAGYTALYVHIADPAAVITFNSPEEKEARDRGLTLYLPEGAARMLAEDYLPVFALGLCEKSAALTFKMTIDEGGYIIDTEIFPSVVKVRRLTYEQADREIDMDTENSPALRAIFDLSRKIFNRRTANGAVNIEFYDIHIIVENETVKIEPIPEYRSNLMVKECMIAAGEGAGTWAASRGLVFPYVCQEVEPLPGKILGGLAGSIQTRRCLRPRLLSVKPGRHQGLGLDTYTQVTSPLRRYTDLLAHILIRMYLRGEKLPEADEISARLGFSEAGASAAVHAERASNNHWIMVYLSDKKNTLFDAIALENKGGRWVVYIPSLAFETTVTLQKDVSPNDNIKLVLKSVNIAKGEAVFLQAH